MHLHLQVPFKDVVFVNLCPAKGGSDVEEDLGQVRRAADRGVDPFAGYKLEVGVEDCDCFVHKRALEGVAGAIVAVDDGEAVALDSV